MSFYNFGDFWFFINFEKLFGLIRPNRFLKPVRSLLKTQKSMTAAFDLYKSIKDFNSYLDLLIFVVR